MPLINFHSALTLKSMLSFELLSFSFYLKGTLTLLRHYIANQKMISETIITDTVKRAFKNYWKIAYYEVKKTKVSTNNTILNIFRSWLSIEDSVSCKQIPQSWLPCTFCKSFIFNVLISCQGRFETIKKLSLRMSWN